MSKGKRKRGKKDRGKAAKALAKRKPSVIKRVVKADAATSAKSGKPVRELKAINTRGARISNKNQTSSQPASGSCAIAMGAKGQVSGHDNPNVLEEIRERKELPADYVFVEKGDVFITRNCRKMTRSAGRAVYYVQSQDRKHLGIGVPAYVHAEVRKVDAETKSARLLAVQSKDARNLETARKLLRKLYPRLPSDAEATILEHAFAKGSGRVGRTGVLGAAQRTHLAVAAHARHSHTSYERLLQKFKREGQSTDSARLKARKVIRTELLYRLRLWAGKNIKQLAKKLQKTQAIH